jgi:flavodoxin short chain
MEKILMIYWSGTGNTEIMANEIALGIKTICKEIDVFNVSDFDINTFCAYDKYLLGCPALGNEELEKLEFEPFFNLVSSFVKNKKVALFGSYAWGNGEWIKKWALRIKDNEGIFFGDIIIKSTPKKTDYKKLREFGVNFNAF